MGLWIKSNGALMECRTLNVIFSVDLNYQEDGYKVFSKVGYGDMTIF